MSSPAPAAAPTAAPASRAHGSTRLGDAAAGDDHDGPPPELIDAAADAAAARDDGGNFEDIERAADAPAANATAQPASEPSTATPSLGSVIEHVPASTRELLRELFKAEITAVKKLPRDQLR